MQLGATGSQSSLRGEMRSSLSAAAAALMRLRLTGLGVVRGGGAGRGWLVKHVTVLGTAIRDPLLSLERRS